MQKTGMVAAATKTSYSLTASVPLLEVTTIDAGLDAIQQLGTSPAAMDTLRHIAAFVKRSLRNHKRFAWPSTTTLAEMSNRSRETVSRRIAALEAEGLLRVTRRKRARGGKNAVNLYELMLPLKALEIVRKSPLPGFGPVRGQPRPFIPRKRTLRVVDGGEATVPAALSPQQKTVLEYELSREKAVAQAKAENAIAAQKARKDRERKVELSKQLALPSPSPEPSLLLVTRVGNQQQRINVTRSGVRILDLKHNPMDTSSKSESQTAEGARKVRAVLDYVAGNLALIYPGKQIDPAALRRVLKKKLDEGYDIDALAKQHLAWLPYRAPEIRNPAGLLITSLSKDLPEPDGYQRAKHKEAVEAAKRMAGLLHTMFLTPPDGEALYYLPTGNQAQAYLVCDIDTNSLMVTVEIAGERLAFELWKKAEKKFWKVLPVR